MELRLVTKERLGWKGMPLTNHLVVTRVGGMDLVVGFVKFMQHGEKRVALWLTSNLHGETTCTGRYATVGDALVGAHDYLSETEVA